VIGPAGVCDGNTPRPRRTDGGGKRVRVDLLAVEGTDDAGGGHFGGAGQRRLALGRQGDVVVGLSTRAFRLLLPVVSRSTCRKRTGMR